MLASLKRLLPQSIYWQVRDIGDITELRVRLGKRLVVYSCTKRTICDYEVYRDDIDYIIKVATGHSLYSAEDTVRKGYITSEGGIRIGVAGEGVLNGEKLVTLKNISSLVIRVPSEIGSIPYELYPLINDFSNTLIISPPYCGKTTLLRAMIRELADSEREVLVIDERGELSASSDGETNLNVGECADVLLGVPKLDCYEGAVRTLSPDIVATDEIFGLKEVDCLIDLDRCGVSFVATVHGDNIDSVMSDNRYHKLTSIVDNYILLSDIPKVGCVKEIRTNCLHS